jgi:hypothetical protein
MSWNRFHVIPQDSMKNLKTNQAASTQVTYMQIKTLRTAIITGTILLVGLLTFYNLTVTQDMWLNVEDEIEKISPDGG